MKHMAQTATILLSAFIVFFGSTGYAQAQTFLGDNGSIAVATKTAIQLISPDGKVKQHITASGAHDLAWSPKGRALAYVDTNGRLWTIIPSTGHKTLVTNDAHYQDSSPAWSADGRLAFVRAPKTKQHHSAIFISNGRYQTNVSGWPKDGGYRYPSWSPDAHQLVYEHYGVKQHALLVRTMHTGKVRQLTTLSDAVASHVVWSPSGAKILFNDSANEVYTIWPDGSHRAVISDGESYAASWSPTGDRVAFIEDPKGDQIGLSLADGSLTWLSIQKEQYQTITSVVWSPDGKQLLVGLANGTDSVLFAVDIQNDSQRLLVRGIVSAAWQSR